MALSNSRWRLCLAETWHAHSPLSHLLVAELHQHPFEPMNRGLFKVRQSAHDTRRRHKACLDRQKSNVVYLTAGTVSISAQIEAAVKACEAETARVGQDYYSALCASSPTAAKGPAAGKSPAPAMGKSAKGEPAAPAEVLHLDICCKVQESRQSLPV